MMADAQQTIETALHEWVAALDAVDELIFMHDVDGRILRANRAYAARAGLDFEQLIGRYYWDIFPKLPGRFPLCPNTFTAGGLLVKEVLLDTGEILVSRGYAINTAQDGYRYSVHVLHDITESRQREADLQAHAAALTQANAELAAVNDKLHGTESQLMQSVKMASLGELAAGVAHEINNPIGFVRSNLTALDGYVNNLLELLAAYEQLETTPASAEALLGRIRQLKAGMDLAFLKEDVRVLMTESQQGIMRVAKIVQGLKVFSHVDQEDRWALEDLHRGLDSTLSVVWNELKYKCKLKKEYGDLPPVECLLPELNQVFLNLLVNAAQAIEAHGVITLRSGVQDDAVWLEVADNGSGIAPAHLARIFDPFFTTKPAGKGTGLGLSVSYRIVEKHHGRIEVDSVLGVGTTFRLWLPLRQPESRISQ